MEILAVIVRYKTPLSQSQTIEGLSKALREDPDLLKAIGLLLWDNSPQALSDPSLPFPFEYRHSSRNAGVAGAYNGALLIAREAGARWMLLLDQDTSVTAAFLTAMLEHSRRLADRTEIAAIAPIVSVGAFVASPRKMLFNNHRPYPRGESGVAEGEAFAVNSGCLMRTEALNAIGGFSSEFWLDYSDMYVFHQFFQRGLRVWRATDAELQHQMTIMDYDGSMTAWRYTNFIEAEGAYNDWYKGRAENVMQTLRLAVRAVWQRFRYKDPEFSRITRKYLWKRIRMGQSRRLASWQAAQRER